MLNYSESVTLLSLPAKQKPQHSKAKFIAPMAVACLLGGISSIAPALAQQTVDLAPNLSPDPLILQGHTSGYHEIRSFGNTEQSVTGSCVGFANLEPDAILNLTAFFSYLKIEVQSRKDMTILIQGPGGSWCNDDMHGKNPSIAGEWQQGVYRIWVGSYRLNESTPYTIHITTKE